MDIQPYQVEELQFAWCYRVYYRWRTHRARTQRALAELNCEALNSMLRPYDIHILEAAVSGTGAKLLSSLLPTETVAGCAGKTKGRVSRWLRSRLDLGQPQKLLSRGYFACTTGKSTSEAVNRYLQNQGDHHRYTSHARPPVFVKRYPLTPVDEERLSAKHAKTVLRFHVVLSTWRRKGVFSRAAAEAVSGRWRRAERECQMVVEKGSFVADHVHLSVRAHPSLSPATVVIVLMNASQQLMWDDFADSVIRSGVERLWQPSAYVGSFGDLNSARVASYVRNWEQDARD